MNAPAPAPVPATQGNPLWTRRELLYKRVYRFRMLGMGLGCVPLLAGIIEQGGGWLMWAALVFGMLLWPHLAYWRAARSSDPYRAESVNLLLDSLQAGLIAGLLRFNPLPTALLLTVATIDKINSGVPGLWKRSLPWMLAGTLLGGAAAGFRVNLDTSLLMVVACLPMLLIHLVAVSVNGARLMRRVQQQNRELERLNNVDMLTGLAARRCWEERATRMLRQTHAGDVPASLLLLDVDCFKAINDGHGHAVGDDALVLVGHVLTEVFPAPACGGRLGGDEFVVVAAMPLDEAMRLGERARAQVAASPVGGDEQLKCTLSCGVAQTGAGINTLGEWLAAADAALYVAKRGGRNRLASHVPGLAQA